MKRFLILIGVLSIALGVRLYNNGLIGSDMDGTWSRGDYDVTEIEKPLLISGPHRLDLQGDRFTAKEIMSSLCAKELLCEQVDDIIIYYAYSVRLLSPVTVHGYRVNLMIAVSDGKVVAGTPLIYGSY